MGWGQTPRILLVWPRRGQILNRRIDIIYLKRHSITLGAQLAFVTKNPDIRYHAGNQNIPVYPNIKKAEESHWRPAKRRKRKKLRDQKDSVSKLKIANNKRELDLAELREAAYPKHVHWLFHPIIRLTLFTTGVLSVLAIGFLLLPSAEIKIEPKVKQHRISIPITSSSETQTAELTGEIPIRKQHIIVEGRYSIPVSGSIQIPDQKATGEVVFKNLTDRIITLPLGTYVSTLKEPPVRFVLTEPAEVAPGELSGKVPVEAVMPGRSGNVISSQIQAIEGPLGLDLTVSNPLATHGGSNKLSPAPNESDYDRLLELLASNLLETAVDELRSVLASTDIILEIDPENVDIQEAQYVPEEIEPTDQLQLTLRIAYQGYYASGDDLLFLARSISEANLPAENQIVPNSLDIISLSDPVKDEEGAFKWNSQIEWQAQAMVDPRNAIPLIQWQTPEEARARLLNNLPIDGSLEININPDWWKRMPILPFRIKVENISQP
jgi:hypothetical protein